jgi:biopolymer transport protein ExbD
MNFRQNKREMPPAQSSALNDILFILLLFFLIISTLANPNVVKLSIPHASSDTKAKQTVVVSINQQQQFFVGTRQIVPDSLQFYIMQVVNKSQDSEPTVVINAHKDATADNVVKVMKAAHSLNLKTVLAVEKEK